MISEGRRQFFANGTLQCVRTDSMGWVKIAPEIVTFCTKVHEVRREAEILTPPKKSLMPIATYKKDRSNNSNYHEKWGKERILKDLAEYLIVGSQRFLKLCISKAFVMTNLTFEKLIQRL